MPECSKIKTQMATKHQNLCLQKPKRQPLKLTMATATLMLKPDSATTNTLSDATTNQILQKYRTLLEISGCWQLTDSIVV